MPYNTCNLIMYPVFLCAPLCYLCVCMCFCIYLLHCDVICTLCLPFVPLYALFAIEPMSLFVPMYLTTLYVMYFVCSFTNCRPVYLPVSRRYARPCRLSFFYPTGFRVFFRPLHRRRRCGSRRLASRTS